MLVALPALAAQRSTVRPRTLYDSGDQTTIREIVEMERQAKEASLRRDADFSQKTLAEDYVAITPPPPRPPPPPPTPPPTNTPPPPPPPRRTPPPQTTKQCTPPCPTSPKQG